MNILFEVSDKDIMFIGLFGVGIILFGIIIFYVLSKGEKNIEDSEEHFDDKPDELFEDIKPKTKEQQEAKDELERVFKQMSADLEEKNSAPKAIEEFEREQEENAIISYQELIKQAEEKRNNPNKDFAQLEKIDSKDEDLVHEAIEKPKSRKKREEFVPEKKFRNSEIISPIFGTQSPSEYKKDREKKKTSKGSYEDLKANYETDENIDFLNSLKEFRSNL